MKEKGGYGCIAETGDEKRVFDGYLSLLLMSKVRAE
jgi:hypothetical protein